MDSEHALVLGGGGVAGIAWMTGLLTGLADAGDGLTGAEQLIGTSAAGVTSTAASGRQTMPTSRPGSAGSR